LDELRKELRENSEVLEDRWENVGWAVNKSKLIVLWHFDGVLE